MCQRLLILSNYLYVPLYFSTFFKVSWATRLRLVKTMYRRDSQISSVGIKTPCTIIHILSLSHKLICLMVEASLSPWVTLKGDP